MECTLVFWKRVNSNTKSPQYSKSDPHASPQTSDLLNRRKDENSENWGAEWGTIFQHSKDYVRALDSTERIQTTVTSLKD